MIIDVKRKAFFSLFFFRADWAECAHNAEARYNRETRVFARFDSITIKKLVRTLTG